QVWQLQRMSVWCLFRVYNLVLLCSYHVKIKPPALADTVTIETPAEVQPAEVVPASEPPTSETPNEEAAEITPEQLQMEQLLAGEAIMALHENVSMCNAEAEEIAQQIRDLLNKVIEFWSIHGEIYYTYDS